MPTVIVIFVHTKFFGWHLSMSGIYQLLLTQFWPKIFLTYHFWNHIILPENFVPKICWDQNILYPKSFGLKFCLTLIFLTKTFWDLTFLPRFFFGSNTFKPRVFFLYLFFWQNNNNNNDDHNHNFNGFGHNWN